MTPTDSTPVVLDCSMALSFCFASEFDATARAALKHVSACGACVPEVWPLEVANVLAIAERRGRMGEADIAFSIRNLQALPVELDRDTAPRLARDAGARPAVRAHRL